MKEEAAIFAPALVPCNHVREPSPRLLIRHLHRVHAQRSIVNDASRRTIPPFRGQSSSSIPQTSERYSTASLGFEFFTAFRTATESSTVVASPLLWFPRSNALRSPISSSTMHLWVMGDRPEQLFHPGFPLSSLPLTRKRRRDANEAVELEST